MMGLGKIFPRKVLFAVITFAGIISAFILFSAVISSKNGHAVSKPTLASVLEEPMVTWKPSLQQFKLSKEILLHGKPLQVADLDLYILTAVYYENFPAKNGFNIFLNGWIRHKLQPDFLCCLRRTIDGTMISARAYSYHITENWIVNMQHGEFSCSVSEEQLKSVGGAGFKFITFAEKSCFDAPDLMLEIVYPERIVDSVGVCPKVLYGNLDPIRLIEWFEYTKMMNVTRVFTYYADIDPVPLKVLDYYSSTGFLETYKLHAPAKKGSPLPHFTRPRDEHQAWINEIAAINDCKLRMSGFDYVIVMDVDEYIIPKDNASVVKPGDGNYLSILEKASQTCPDAAGFQLNAFVTMLSWGKSRDSPLFLTSYVKRTKRKNISLASQESRWALVPKRTFYSVNNLVFPRKPWKNCEVPETLYILLHFRTCKTWSWKNCDSMSRVEDMSLVPYEKPLVTNLLKLPLYALTNDSSLSNKLKSWLTYADYNNTLHKNQ